HGCFWHHHHCYLFKVPATRTEFWLESRDENVFATAQSLSLFCTHEIRTFFALNSYKRGIAIALLQKHFHHATPSETLKYLGISKDETFKTEIDVDL
ncbi:hypothetical protein ACUOCP_42830, partial [Escherichia sp. R-CC3]